MSLWKISEELYNTLKIIYNFNWVRNDDLWTWRLSGSGIILGVEPETIKQWKGQRSNTVRWCRRQGGCPQILENSAIKAGWVIDRNSARWRGHNIQKCSYIWIVSRCRENTCNEWHLKKKLTLLLINWRVSVVDLRGFGYS